MKEIPGNHDGSNDQQSEAGLAGPPPNHADTSRKWTLFFGAVLLFVGGVSLYDGYLVVRTGDMILDFEQNPAGRFLIAYNFGDPSLFLRLKAAGTLVVLAVMAELHRHSRRLASPVAWALLLFQSGLLFYLENPL